MSEKVLSSESAKKELKKFYDYYEVDLEDFPKESQEALQIIEPVIIRGIQRGLIEFKEDDEKGFVVIQKLKGDRGEITYKELNGDAKMAMNSKSENDTSGRCYALLGSLSGEGAAVIRKLKGPDLKRAEHIGAVFLFC